MGSWRIAQPISWGTRTQRFLFWTWQVIRVKERHTFTGEERWVVCSRQDIYDNAFD